MDQECWTDQQLANRGCKLEKYVVWTQQGEHHSMHAEKMVTAILENVTIVMEELVELAIELAFAIPSLSLSE